MIAAFLSKLWRIISVQDVFLSLSPWKKMVFVASSTVLNAIEATAKILGPLALAKSVDMIENKRDQIVVFEYGFSPVEMIYASVFLSILSAVAPEVRRFLLADLGEQYVVQLTNDLLISSQQLSINTPKNQLGNDLIKPLQKHLYLLHSKIPELVVLVSDNMQPLIFDILLGFSATFYRFGGDTSKVLLTYVAFAFSSNLLFSSLAAAPESNNQAQRQFSATVSNWFDVLNKTETVHLFNRCEYELSEACADYAKYILLQKECNKKARWASLQVAVNSMVQLLAVYYFSRNQFNNFDVDEIIFLIGYLANIGRSIGAINRSWRGASDIIESIDDAKNFIQSERVSCLATYRSHAFQFNHPYAVEFKNVSFHYQFNECVLNAVNFKIPSGKFTAIVGATNSGKTSISKLLTKLITPDYNSQIIIHGCDVRDLSDYMVRDHISVTTQFTDIFRDNSLRYNISYGYVSDGYLRKLKNTVVSYGNDHYIAIDDDQQEREQQMRLNRLASSVALENIVDRSKSAGLSGGETQRVGIARMLARKSSIYILDEATSSLDSKTEHAVLETVQRVTRGKTVIMIAHRLATIRHADHILFFKNPDKKGSRVTEQGTHDELLALNGDYAELYRLQSH